MKGHGIRRFFVVLLLLLSLGSPAYAASEWRVASGEWREKTGVSLAARHSPLATEQAILLADSWGIGRFFSGGGRARVVQISVVAMSIALFIMMRKFNG